MIVNLPALNLLWLRKKKSNQGHFSFMSGKLLMFAQLSLKSSIYDLVETFYFPSQLLLDIYKKYKIEKIEINHPHRH